MDEAIVATNNRQGDVMNCFECGSKCVTVYLVNERWVLSPMPLQTIKAVRKNCLSCEWHSYPTRIPTTRQKILLDFEDDI